MRKEVQVWHNIPYHQKNCVHCKSRLNYMSLIELAARFVIPIYCFLKQHEIYKTFVHMGRAVIYVQEG
jgi:hypothetical protein